MFRLEGKDKRQNRREQKSEDINILDSTFVPVGVQNKEGSLVLWGNEWVFCVLPRSNVQKPLSCPIMNIDALRAMKHFML